MNILFSPFSWLAEICCVNSRTCEGKPLGGCSSGRDDSFYRTFVSRLRAQTLDWQDLLAADHLGQGLAPPEHRPAWQGFRDRTGRRHPQPGPGRRVVQHRPLRRREVGEVHRDRLEENLRALFSNRRCLHFETKMLVFYCCPSPTQTIRQSLPSARLHNRAFPCVFHNALDTYRTL